jgi:hypothetical protein
MDAMLIDGAMVSHTDGQLGVASVLAREFRLKLVSKIEIASENRT